MKWNFVLALFEALFQNGYSIRHTNISHEVTILLLSPSSPAECFDDLTDKTSSGFFNLAMEEIKAEKYFGDKMIIATMLDSNCSERESLSGFLHGLSQVWHLKAVFGPVCTSAMIDLALVTSVGDYPTFAWAANRYHPFELRKKATSLIRLLPPIDKLVQALILLCKYFKWNRVAMLSATHEVPHDFHDINTAYKNTGVEMHMAEAAEGDSYCGALKDLRTTFHIFILDVPAERLRECLLTARALSMTSGDYEFLSVAQDLNPLNFSEVLKSGAFWRRHDGKDAEAKEAFGNLLLLTFPYVIDFKNREGEMKLKASQAAKLSNDSQKRNDLYAPFLYDAVRLFARVYNDTGGTLKNVQQTIRNMNFIGLTGPVYLDWFGDRMATVLVWNMEPNSGGFVVVGNVTEFFNSNGTSSNQSLKISNVFWGNMSCPDEVPTAKHSPCDFCGQNCDIPKIDDKKGLGRILSVVGVAVLVPITVLLVVFCYRRLHRWRIGQRNEWDIQPSRLGMVRSIREKKKNSINSDSICGEPGENSFSAGSYNIGLIHVKVFELDNSDKVQLHRITHKDLRPSPKFRERILKLKSIKHDTLVHFYGVCYDISELYGVWEFCPNGSLQNLMRVWTKKSFLVESLVQFSFARDIISGLKYIHNSDIKVHGQLRSDTCYVNEHWVCRLSGFGVGKYYEHQDHIKESKCVEQEDFILNYSGSVLDSPRLNMGCAYDYTKLFWTAPELVRDIVQSKKAVEYTQQADIYAAGMILKELITLEEPYERELKRLSAKAIIEKISDYAWMEDPFRPYIKDVSENHLETMLPIIEACWEEAPSHRPTATILLRKLRRAHAYPKTDNITSSLLKAMYTYSNKLEDTVAERTRELAEEKTRTDALLYQMLPKAVANELKGGKAAPAQAYDSVTIYFSDIVGFTYIASHCKPIQIVALLNSLYTLFDITISEYNVYKVETIGDSYMVASGLPVPNPDHACAVADMALALNNGIKGFVMPHDPGTVIRIRIGLNTGPVVAGVVGRTMPRYCLFGDTVNVASRMESTGVPEKIHVSRTTKEAIGENPNYMIQPRGQIEIKGKGKMQTYFLYGVQKSDTLKLSTTTSFTSEKAWLNVSSASETNTLTSVETFASAAQSESTHSTTLH